MSDEKPMAQMVTLHLEGGKVAKFVGPPAIDRDDSVDGRVKIERVQFGPPFELSTGTFFATDRNGVIVLMQSHQPEDEFIPPDAN